MQISLKGHEPGEAAHPDNKFISGNESVKLDLAPMRSFGEESNSIKLEENPMKSAVQSSQVSTPKYCTVYNLSQSINHTYKCVDTSLQPSTKVGSCSPVILCYENAR